MQPIKCQVTRTRTIENWFSAVKENGRCTREYAKRSIESDGSHSDIGTWETSRQQIIFQRCNRHDAVVPKFWPRFHFSDFRLLSRVWKCSSLSSFLTFIFFFLAVISVSYRFADPSITEAIRNRLWNTRNTCGIFIREYRFAARMSVQRSPVIALVCFPGRHRRLNVANTGNPSRGT